MTASNRVFMLLVLSALVTVAFSVSAGAATYKTLCSFRGGTDGNEPTGSLLHVGGKLYGTTVYGGSACAATPRHCGTVFSITPSGNEQVIYRFQG